MRRSINLQTWSALGGCAARNQQLNFDQNATATGTTPVKVPPPEAGWIRRLITTIDSTYKEGNRLDIMARTETERSPKGSLGHREVRVLLRFVRNCLNPHSAAEKSEGKTLAQKDSDPKKIRSRTNGGTPSSICAVFISGMTPRRTSSPCPRLYPRKRATRTRPRYLVSCRRPDSLTTESRR